MLKVAALVLLTITLGGCMGTQPLEGDPPEPEPSVVSTADEAIAVATEYLRHRGFQEHYDTGSAEASEDAASWFVSVPSATPPLPPTTVIKVSKVDRTAQPIQPAIQGQANGRGITLSDVISFVALFITAGLAFFAATRDRTSRRRDASVRMLERYNSERMSECRYSAYFALDADKENVIEIDPKKKVYTSISEITHFWSDLNKLWADEMVDRKLTISLFKQPWRDVWGPRLNRLTYVDPPGEKRKDEKRKYAQKFNDWDKKNVTQPWNNRFNFRRSPRS